MISATSQFEFLTERTGQCVTPKARGIGHFGPKGLDAMVVFDQWTPGSAEIHMAIDNPMATRALARAVIDYAFGETGRTVLLARIVSTNTRSVQLAEWLGFREVARIEDAWDSGADIVILRLHKSGVRTGLMRRA